MNDIDALAEGLHETAHKNHNLGEGMARAICQSVESHTPRATAFAATPPVAELLRLAAIGRAVERLPVYVEAIKDDTGWMVAVMGDAEKWRPAGEGPDLPAAIAAALGDE